MNEYAENGKGASARRRPGQSQKIQMKGDNEHRWHEGRKSGVWKSVKSSGS